jgi:HlyD family secretion protein
MMAEAGARIAELSIRLEQLREYERRSTLRSPVDGTIIDLAVLHPGSMIDATEPAVILAPDGRPLLARIEVANADMRRLREGLGVLMELDAFPREDHGVVDGTLLEIEPEANGSGQYCAWVSLDDGPNGRDSLIRQLRPGLLLEARIIIDHRRLSGFLTKPFRRLAEPISIGE